MKLRSWRRNKLHAAAVWLLFSMTTLYAQDFQLTKHLTGVPGRVGLTGGQYEMNFAWGETFAGELISFSSATVEPGYYSGRFGAGQTFSIERVQVGGTPAYFQNGLQIGVTVQAEVAVIFSDQLAPESIPEGVHAAVLQDHLSNPQNQPAAVSFDYDAAQRRLLIHPAGVWLGNTVYDVALVPDLRSINGYSLNTTTHIRFLTMADPHEQNRVTNALLIDPFGKAPLGAPGGVGLPSLDLSSEALSDYAVLLFSDHLEAPDTIDRGVLKEADEKARASGGPYRSPLHFIEISAYNPAGQKLAAMSRPAHLSVGVQGSEGWAARAPVAIRTSSLALWHLDQAHRLWVKIPESEVAGERMLAPVSRFSLYAVMGSAEGNASDAFVFPNPWRPAGPNAGDAPGQTGTEQGGISFSNLPSECRIDIYTLSGFKVQTLTHSDAAGPVAQQVWDGNNASGSHAASGVYLWRVQSSQDFKTGKLMIIR